MARFGLPRALHRLRSIRYRLIAGVTLVHAVLMALLVADLMRGQATFLVEQSRDQTRSLAQTVAVSGASWVMANDVVGLQEVVQSVARAPDVSFVMVVDLDGRVLAHSQREQVGRWLQDEVSLGMLARPATLQTLVDDGRLIDVAAPVLAGVRPIAWARVGTGQERIAAELARVRREGFAFAAAAVGFGALIAALLAHGLIRGLALLVSGIAQVRAGRRGFRLALQRNDEIGTLGQAFDGMVESLEATEAGREQAMQALQASEERFRDLSKMSADWFWEQDADLRFTVMSSGISAKSGIDRLSMLGQRRWELPFVIADDATWSAHRAALERHEPIVEFSYQVRNEAGELRWFVIDGRPLFDAAGRFAGYRGVGRDITERKRAEAAQKALEAQLRESQKMEAIGTLAGGIAHDFNNNLGAILGHATLARHELPPGHPVLAHLEQIAKSGARARNLVRRILSFSRRGTGERRDQPLQPLIEDTLAMLAVTLPASVRMASRLCDTPLFVHADATQLQQVLMNLCTNAWQALEGRPGEVVVGLRALPAGAGDRPPGLAAGEYAHLWVSDTGAGMAAATRARIFEPFFTTKPEGQGTGLGLAMVHGIVASHSGVITVDTEPGRGTTFHIYLPQVHPGPAQTEERAGDARAAPLPRRGHGEHVLYLDDDDVMVLLVEQLLLQLGYRVSCFQDARQAVAAVRERGEQFDLVITDYNMPILSGLDVARAVAEAQPGLPVVIGSGRVPDELRQVVGTGNVRGVVQKEQMIEQLGAVVARVLAERERAQTPG